MKKLFIIALLILTQAFYAQVSTVKVVRIADATTTFSENIPVGTQVYNIATEELWVTTEAVTSASTLTTASGSFNKIQGLQTSSNGLTVVTDDVKLGGTLTEATNITTDGSNDLTITQTGSAWNALTIDGTGAATNSTALLVNTAKHGINSVTSSASGVAGTFAYIGGDAASILSPFNLTRLTTGTALDGMGLDIPFILESSNGSSVEAVSVQAVLDDATFGTINSSFRIKTYATTGGLSEKFRIDDEGGIDFSIYGLGNKTGTATYFLGVDANGNVTEEVIPGGGDMLKSTYDPANISEQLVGLTATQTLTNKTIDVDNNTILNIGNAEIGRVAGSTYSTVQDMQNIFHSAGSSSTGDVTDAGGNTVDVPGGTGFIRISNSSVAEVLYFDWSTSLGLSVPLNTTRYIGVEYNAGSPQVTVRTSDNFNDKVDFFLAVAVNEGGTIYIKNSPHAVGDHASNMIIRLKESMGIRRDNVMGGIIIGETGTRNITVTAGGLWDRLSRFPISAINTSVSDNFDRYYSDGASGHTKEPAQTQWNNTQYDDGTGSLATLGNNKWGVQWWYMELDGALLSMYGTVQHNTLAEAETEAVPTDIPDRLSKLSLLIGRTIFQKSDATLTSIESSFTKIFGGSLITDHSSLANLAADDHPQYLLADGTRALTGNLAVDGSITVDGRDISVDGTKLDGIEDNATADQTTIVGITGTKAQFDTSLTDGNFQYAGDTASDSELLDGIDSPSFLRSDVADTKSSGDLSFSTGAHLNMKDLAFTRYGNSTEGLVLFDGTDMLFRLNGANYRIQDAAAGNAQRFKFDIPSGTLTAKTYETDGVSSTVTGLKLVATSSSTDNKLIDIHNTGGGFRFGFEYDNTGIGLNIVDRNRAALFSIKEAGNVGVNKSSPSEKFEVGGNVKADSFIKLSATSDDILLGDGTDVSLLKTLNYPFLKTTDDVIFLAITGQSNAGEQALNTDASAGEKKDYDNIFVWNTTTNLFDVYNPTTYGNTLKHNIILGLAIQFESELPNTEVYICNYAVGASAIEEHIDGGSVYNVFYPEYYLEAKDNLIAAGKNPYAWLLMFQGEADSATTPLADAYDEKHKQWVDLWKQTVGFDLPLMNIGVFEGGANRVTVNDAFKNREGDRTNYNYVDTNGTVTSDGDHYTYADFKNIIAPDIIKTIINTPTYLLIGDTKVYNSSNTIDASTLIPKSYQSTLNFAERSLTDSGTLESLDVLNYDLSNITTESIQLTPNAYKTSKLYGLEVGNSTTGTLADFTFTRATTATKINSVGTLESVSSNILKIDYNNSDTGYLSLEPATTNLSLRSEEFDNASWAKTNSSVTTNTLYSPDNTLSSEKLTRTSTSASYVRLTLSKAASPLYYSFSVFIKNDAANYAAIRIQGAYPERIDATFNLNTNTTNRLTSNTFTNISSSIVDYGGGWYKLQVSGLSGSGTDLSIFVSSSDDDIAGVDTTSAFSSSSIFLWGSQLEQSSFTTSYMPTTTSSVTRNADELNNAGSTAVINSQEGVLYIDTAALFNDGTTRTVSLSDGTAANAVTISYNATSNQIEAEYINASTAQATMAYNVTDATDFHKIAIRYAVNDFSLWIDGKKRAEDTNGSVTSINTFDVINFDDGAGANDFYGRVKSLKVFTTFLSDIEIYNLTTINDYTPKHLARTNVNPYFTSDVTVSGDVVANSVNGTYRKKVSLSSAQILALNTTPIELVAAPGSGRLLAIKSMVVKYNYNTIAYNTDKNFIAVYNGETISLASIGGVEIDATTDKIKGGAIALIADMHENKALDIYIAVSDPTTGDGTADVYITYEIIEL